MLSSTLTGMSKDRELFTLSDKTVQYIRDKYGEMAERRLHAWQKIIREDHSKNDLEKLEKVNDFFNQVSFVSDKKHWGKSDYWATPVEFLATGGGDCEDFSLAKYFTLKAIGVDESKLHMAYVKAIKLNQAHMVVTYYETPKSIPLILDNLDKTIQPATRRNDLVPVFSFNGLGLWMSKVRGKGKKVKDGNNKLKNWQNLLSRLPDELK